MKLRKRYSVCITNYNSIDTIKSSLESLFCVINDDFEIVVCDNVSEDGSRAILEDYAAKRKIKLIVQRCSRGRGRMIAFENSVGEYIISGIDTDDKLKKNFQTFLNIYHKRHEGYMLSAGTIHIIPRHIVEEIGGWRDLTWGEDIDFYKRAKCFGKQHDFGYSIDLADRGNNKRGFIDRLLERYDAAKCYYRIGKPVSQQVKMSTWLQKPVILILAVSALVECKSKHIKKFEYLIKK